MLRHIVLFKIYADTSIETMEKAKRLLTKLGDFPGVIEWTVEASIDTRKGVVLVQNGLFESSDVFEKYRISDFHKEVGAFMSQIADWVVGDYIEQNT